jgi:hypothetical protein
MRHTGGLLAAALSMVFSWSDGLEARLWIASGLPTIRELAVRPQTTKRALAGRLWDMADRRYY